MSAITHEVAEKEILTWVPLKRLSDRKKESFKDITENLIDAMMDGHLVLREDGCLVQKLQEPKGDLKQLEFKNRIEIGEIHKQTANEKTDGDVRTLAVVAALTGQAKGFLRKLEPHDYSVSQSIAVFFL